MPIFCSPKISARARERYRMAASKSDTFDAYVLADTLRHEHRHWRPLSPSPARLAELRAISRDRQRVLYAQQACENRLRATMDAYHPAPLHLFSTLDRDISLAFIADYPTPEQAGRVAASRMEAFCRRHGCSGRTKPQVLVDRMRPHLLTAVGEDLRWLVRPPAAAGSTRHRPCVGSRSGRAGQGSRCGSTRAAG